MASGTVRPGIFTADGVLVPVAGGPWIIGQPPVIRVAYAGKLYVPSETRTWTTGGWVTAARPS
jgi:hypothetical protein